MRVAALFDIHGNLPALEAVLAEVDASGCDRILVGGDVALGPMPRQTLDLLTSRGENAQFIRGNCDREMASVLAREPDPTKSYEGRLRWSAENVTPAQCEMLGSLPLTVELPIDGLGSVLFCHGSPRSDEEIVTRLTPEARLAGMLAGVTQPMVVSGHTHVQFDREVCARRWVNAGSIGMPYEGRPGAFWALLGPTVELRSTPYDYERAAAAIRATGFPDAEEFVTSNFASPITAADASQLFEQMADDRSRTRAAR